MPDEPLLLGIDVATTGCKTLLMDASGEVVCTSVNEYALSTPRPNWSEQNPHDWHNATVAGIRSVLQQSGVAPDRIAAVGLTGQMHGLVLLDGSGRVLRPAIIWNDQRTGDQCDEIAQRVGAHRVIQLTGNPVLTGFSAPKLLWVRQHEPEVFEAVAAVLLPKDYVRYRLTGQRWSDVSDASGTSLFDVAHRRWSAEMIEAVSAKRSWLPEVTESDHVCATINADGARATGLAVGTPVVAGAGDQAAQAIGCGIVDEANVSVTIGTSGVVFAASKAYRVEPAGKLHAYCHAVPDMWHLMGVMLSAGGSLRWYRDVLCEAECARARRDRRDPYDLLMEQAASAPAGCDGLLFLPYLTGERTPHADPNARGVFFGLTLRHTKAHLTRAVIEGVTFGLRDSIELMRGLGIAITQVRVSGGGANSEFWRQVLADVLNCPVTTTYPAQGAACGAALLAGVGAGIFPSVAGAARATITIGHATTPGPSAAIYADVYPRFQALYPAVAEQFDHD